MELNILPCSTSPLSTLITPLPANIFTNKFAPNVANNISKNKSFVLLLHFICLRNTFQQPPGIFEGLNYFHYVFYFFISISLLLSQILRFFYEFMHLPLMLLLLILLVSTHFWPIVWVPSLSMATLFWIMTLEVC